MNNCADILAFQGTGMVNQPLSLTSREAAKEAAKEAQLRTIEYRIGEILSEGGFSSSQFRSIMDAVMANIRSGSSLDPEGLSARLREAGFVEEIARAISLNISPSGRRWGTGP